MQSYAIEGWGLMTFDQQRLLFNPKREAGYGMYRALDVICHEMAHQWVGDLVTMATWVSCRVPGFEYVRRGLEYIMHAESTRPSSAK